MADLKSKVSKEPLVYAPTAEGKLARDANRYRMGNAVATPTPEEEDEASLRKKIAEFETKRLKPVEYQTPDMEEGRTEYDSAVQEAKKAYHEERDMNELKESAGMIGKALAQFGAGVEGQKLGRPIGALDFGKGIDFGARTQGAYRDYLDELKDLQNLRQEREKAKTTDARMKFDAAAKQQELEVETQLKGLNARLEMLKDKKRERKDNEMTPFQKESIRLQEETQARAERAAEARDKKASLDSLTKEIARLDNLTKNPKAVKANMPGLMEEFGVDERSTMEAITPNAMGGKDSDSERLLAQIAKRKLAVQAEIKAREGGAAPVGGAGGGNTTPPQAAGSPVGTIVNGYKKIKAGSDKDQSTWQAQ